MTNELASDALDLEPPPQNVAPLRKVLGEYATKSGSSFVSIPRVNLSLLLVNRELHDEAGAAFFRRNKFGICTNPADTLVFLASLPGYAQDNLRDLHLMPRLDKRGREARVKNYWNDLVRYMSKRLSLRAVTMDHQDVSDSMNYAPLLTMMVYTGHLKALRLRVKVPLYENYMGKILQLEIFLQWYPTFNEQQLPLLSSLLNTPRVNAAALELRNRPPMTPTIYSSNENVIELSKWLPLKTRIRAR